MTVSEIMTGKAIFIDKDEPITAAARLLKRYNIGALPVCASNGRLCGVVTDRDLVIRCVAAGKDPGKTTVGQVMTGQVTSVEGDMDVSVAAHLMGRQQIRRLPVTEKGRLCGMISLGDMALRDDTAMDAADALGDIARNLSER